MERLIPPYEWYFSAAYTTTWSLGASPLLPQCITNSLLISTIKEGWNANGSHLGAKLLFSWVQARSTPRASTGLDFAQGSWLTIT